MAPENEPLHPDTVAAHGGRGARPAGDGAAPRGCRFVTGYSVSIRVSSAPPISMSMSIVID